MPPPNNPTIEDLWRHSKDIDFFLKNVVTKGQANISDADVVTIVSKFNELLALLRSMQILKV